MRYSVLILSLLFVACAGHRPQIDAATAALQKAEETYLISGNVDDAKTQLEALVSDDKVSPAATFLLADLLDTTGEPHEAASNYFKTLEQIHAQGGHENIATAAAMAIVAIRDRADHFNNRIEGFYNKIGQLPGKLPAEAWYQLQNLKFGLSRRLGDKSVSATELKKIGCPTKWQAIGPVGPWVWQGFDTENKQLENGRPWPATYDLGPGRGITKAWEVDSETCFVKVYNPAMPMDGVTFARTVIVREKSGRVSLRIQTVDAISLRVGGTEVYRRDTRDAFGSKVAWVEVELPKGAVEIVAKIAARSANPSFSLILLDEELEVAYSAQDPTALGMGRGGVKVVKGVDKHGPHKEQRKSQETSSLAAVPGILDILANLKISLWWDDLVQAEDYIRLFERDGQLSPILLQAKAEARSSNPSYPGHLGYEQARRMLVSALEREPRLWYARIGLADRELDEERVEEAIKILETGASLTPREPKIARRLAGTFLSYGWYAEAMDAVDNLVAILPSSCNTLAWQLTLAKERSRFREVSKIAEKISKCDAFSKSLAESLALSQKWEDVLKEAKRLADYTPKNVSSAVDLIEATLAYGDLTQAAEAVSNALALSPVNIPLLIRKADILAASGDVEGAKVVLEKGLSSPLAAKPVLMEALAALDQEVLLLEHRIDGLEIVERYQKVSPDYDASAVYVLDRAVYKVDEDGSYLMVVHAITHLKTDEAVEKHSELKLPPGAALLTARTIKSDGRILEPETIEGKPSYSLPSLEPGDFVESEYVLFSFPNQLFPGGFDTDRFYFKDFETAFHRTEIIVMVPDEMAVIADPRGPCPLPKETKQNDLRVFTWKTQDANPHPEEPYSPVATEYLPSIRVVANASWENLLSQIRDMLADKKRQSPLISSTVKTILSGIDSQDHSAKKRAIFRWVMDHVEESGDLFDEASHIIADKSGNRARAFMALMRAAGYDARLLLIHPDGSDETKDPVPSLKMLGELGVHVPGDGYMDFTHEYAPYGFLAPRLRSRPAIYVDTGKWTETDGGSVPYDTQKIEMSVTLDRDGSATGHVREILSGVFAAEWRRGLQSNNEVERNRMFQGAYLSTAIPGAVLKNLDVKGRNTPDTPLILDYEMDIYSFADEEESGLRVEIPYTTNVGKQTGGLPDRTTALVMGLHVKKTVQATVTPPKGYRFASIKKGENTAKSEWGDAKKVKKYHDGNMVLKYDVKLDASRIETDNYKEFLAFAQKLDKISKMVVQLELEK